MEYNRGLKSATKSSPSQERKMASDGLHIMGNLRDEQEDKQRLEKSNFDLKMKVYYLEESLKRFQDGESMSDIQTDNQKVEISKLKLQLEDKQIDLEQRNLLLIKSKNAIEALKTEIERLRNENDHHQDLEDRIRRLKQLNEDIEADYRGQITQLEQQLSSARQLVDSRTIEKATSEDKMSHLELSYEQIDHHLKDTQQEKRRIQEQLSAAQQKMSAMEDDITQSRAHMDLYRIELQELGEERDGLKEKLRQEQLARLKADEDAKVRLSDCTKHYESQIRTMRTNHEQDMEKIRAGHMEMLADVRENYQSELARAKAEMERNFGDVRQADSLDLSRMKENFTVRIEEKNEEIKSLRAIMNGDSQRVDSLLQELDATRLQLREKSQLAEKLLVETTTKTEELKVVPRIIKDLEECRSNLNALQAANQREHHEKNQLATQTEQLSAALETLRADLRQRENALQTAQNDNSRLIRDVTDLTSKADGVEVVSRENERLKGNVARLETEGLSLNHKISELKKELELAVKEHGKAVHECENIQGLLRGVQNKLDVALDQQEALHIQDQSERERRSAAESALAETRAVLAQSRDELHSERASKLEAQKHAERLGEETREMRHSLGQAVVMSYNAMEEWDETLSEVLDGDMFTVITRSGHGKSSHHTRSSHTSGVSSSLLLNENRSGELLTMSTEQLLQRVAVRVERVGLKLQRTEKIRSLFMGQAEKLVDLVQQGMHNSQERITLYHHKLAESQSQFNKLKSAVHRDRKQRDDEAQELTQFKEVVLSQHTAQIRDSEIRFAQVTQQLEHEKSRSEELQRQVAAQSDELRSLQQINQRMHEDLEVLERTEKIVVDLSHRAGELGELNRSLNRDNEHKADVIMNFTKENSELKLELSSMVSRAESLLQQLRSREDAIEESEAKLQGLVREIERLRTRQIHPDLAKTIQDTQSILQSAVRGNSSGMPPPLPSRASTFSASSGSSADKIAEYLLQVDHLENVAADLIRRSSEMVVGFEAQHMSSSRVTRGAAALTALKQEVYDLLDANSALSVQMQQLVADFKKSIRQLQLVGSATAQDAPRQLNSHAHEHRSSHSHSALSGLGLESSTSMFPSRRALMTPSSSLEHTMGMNIDDLRLESRSPTKSPLKYEDFSEPQYSSSIRNTLNMSSTQRLAPASPDVFASTSKSARFHSTPTVSATPAHSLAHSSAYKQDEGRHLTFDSSALRTGGGGSTASAYQPASSYGAGAYTPNTASRMSTNRLNKLGSDLEALAKKLDSYDTSRTK